MKLSLKKLFCVVFVASAIFAVAVPEQQAEAQYITYTTYCCDGNNYVRCRINPTPMFNDCFCYNQGWGHAC